MTKKASAEATVRNIRRKTRRKYSAEEKIRIILNSLRGDHSIAKLCRREGIGENFTTAGVRTSPVLRLG